MSEISEVTKEHIESELDAAVQCAGIQVCQTTNHLSNCIASVLTAYTIKLTEEIKNCKSMHEVHDALDMNAIGVMPVQPPAKVPSEGE